MVMITYVTELTYFVVILIRYPLESKPNAHVYACFPDPICALNALNS